MWLEFFAQTKTYIKTRHYADKNKSGIEREFHSQVKVVKYFSGKIFLRSAKVMGVKNLGLINLPTSTLHPALYNLASEEMNMPVLCQDLHYCELHDQIFPLTLCGKTVLLSLKFRFIK